VPCRERGEDTQLPFSSLGREETPLGREGLQLQTDDSLELVPPQSDAPFSSLGRERLQPETYDSLELVPPQAYVPPPLRWPEFERERLQLETEDSLELVPPQSYVPPPLR